jgi:signal-transduction protein with cAMP-binding, CBS, and nucleotidyltransferase domain
MSKLQEKLRRDSTFMHAKTLQGSQKSKNPLRIQGEKLRKSSASMHRAIAAEVVEAKELFGEFRILKSQGESIAAVGSGRREDLDC